MGKLLLLLRDLNFKFQRWWKSDRLRRIIYDKADFALRYFQRRMQQNTQKRAELKGLVLNGKQHWSFPAGTMIERSMNATQMQNDNINQAEEKRREHGRKEK